MVAGIDSAIRRTRGEAIPAIDRLVAARIERHFRHAAAVAARCREHLTRTAGALAATAAAAGAHLLARLTAIRTAVRFILKTFLLVKALFARTEDELASTVHTVEHFIYVHETRNSLENSADGVDFLRRGEPSRESDHVTRAALMPRFCDPGGAGPCLPTALS